MTLVTFTKDVHIVDFDAGIERYFCFDDTVDITSDEDKLIQAYAKKWNLKDGVYVKGDQPQKDEYVQPDEASPSYVADKSGTGSDAKE